MILNTDYWKLSATSSDALWGWGVEWWSPGVCVCAVCVCSMCVVCVCGVCVSVCDVCGVRVCGAYG
jgi:hypothetical protein